MRKIDLRISNARKKLADSEYKKRSIEIDRSYSHIRVNDLTFPMMRQQEKVQYFQIYAEWMKIKVRARLRTYLDAFKEEGLVPNDADLSEMSWAFQEVIDNFTTHLPQELSASLQQLGRMQVIEDARRDIDLFAQRMSIEQMKAESQRPQPPSVIHYNTHIYGDNSGNFQQGGEENIQSTNRSNDEAKRGRK
jgi:hypothetical protein